MSDAPRDQLVILESRLADSALAELRTLASVTQVLPPRLALVRSDRATTARIAQIPGVLSLHDQTLGVVPPDLTAAERTFVDAWAARRQPKKRPGDDLPWDAPGFKPPDMPGGRS